MSYHDTDWSLVDFDEPKKASADPHQTEKGTCPKCGKHVGKGIHFHVKNCDVNRTSAR